MHVCTRSRSGLPDGFFSNPKSQFGKILEGLRLENVDIFYGHLKHFTDIWDILWPFGTFVFIRYIFPVLVSCTKKNLATLESDVFCAKKKLKAKKRGLLFTHKQEFRSGKKSRQLMWWLFQEGFCNNASLLCCSGREGCSENRATRFFAYWAIICLKLHSYIRDIFYLLLSTEKVAW
jgi:hypothetical protein